MSDKFLSQDEIDSLLEDVDGERYKSEKPKPKSEAEGAVSYDLATQERIVRGRMATLEIINERFARLLRIELFNFLRRTVETSAGAVRIVKYSEFVRNLVIPTNINLIHATPLRGTGMVVLDPSLVFLVVDTMFGGDGRFHTRIEGRDFTQTEHRIIQRILDIVFDNYQKSWQPVHPLNFEYLRSEMNTQFANIATPNEVVVAITFNIEMGTGSGDMHMCFPYSMLEPIRDLLSSPLQGEVLGVNKRWEKLMVQQVQSAELEVVANLASAEMAVADLIKLKSGDVIPITIDETIEGTVEGIPVMECRYGVSNGQYSLKVEKMVPANESELMQGEAHGE